MPATETSGVVAGTLVQPGLRATTGAVTVEAENGDFSQAQCLTSLDGASFAP